MVHQICHEFRAMDDIVVDAPESAAPSVGAAAPSGGAAASAPAGAGDTAESAELARRMDALRASPAAVALRELDASVRLCPGDAYFYDEALGQVVVQRKATFVAYGLARRHGSRTCFTQCFTWRGRNCGTAANRTEVPQTRTV